MRTLKTPLTGYRLSYPLEKTASLEDMLFLDIETTGFSAASSSLYLIGCIYYEAGEFHLINLGVSVQLPEGYEMIIAPRSSTYKNFGLIQTNSIGVVDESYCGDNDILRMPVKADRHTEIHVNDRVCQFRIMKHQPTIVFEEVEHLEGQDRGGFGTTGIK